MQVNVQKLSPVLVEVDVQIAPERVSEELDKAYSSLRRTAKVRGFRPGKAPRKVLAQMFGSRIARDVAQRLVDETFQQAVSQQQIRPINDPAFEPEPVRQNAPFTYKARFEVVPSIDGVDYADLSAKRPSAEPTDEQVAEELEHLRQHHATLEPVLERGAQAGDVASIDFTVEAGGASVDDAGSEGFRVEVGSGQVLKQIEDAILGKKPGEKFDAQADMPPQHPHPRLAGKTATFSITLVELKAPVLPELDDEFAKDVDEAFESLADLQRNVREQLAARLKEQAENAVAEQLVVELCKKNPIPVPPSLVLRQAQITEQEVLAQARARGQRGGVGEELRARIMQDAEIKVRAGLLMAEIAKAESIQIGDAEIEEGLKELAKQSGKNVAKLRAEYRDKQKREMLVGMILENKVLDIIEGKAKIDQVSAAEAAQAEAPGAASASTASTDAPAGEPAASDAPSDSE